MEELFPELITVIQIFLTIPVSVATGERSFSRLKSIKSYKQASMKQDRLNNIAHLSINYDVARSIDYSDIKNKYAKKQACRFKNFFQ